MHLSKIKTIAAVVAVSACAAYAEFGVPVNARVNSLAGVPVSDISGVYSYPVLMTGYLDHIQATWGGGVIAVKSVSDMFSIGVLANQGLMAPEFAADGVNRLGAYGFPAIGAPGSGAVFSDNIAIPHLLLGFDLGAVAFGADVFFEYAGYSSKDGNGSYGGSIMHPGARLSARLGVSDVDLLAKFGIGFPSISAEGASGQAKLSSDAGLYMEMGAEAGMPIGNADWILGLNYTRADHRFKTGNNSEPNAFCNSRLNGYIGMEFNFVETAVGAFGYSFDRFAATVAQPDVSGEPSTSQPINHLHTLSAGIENAWDKAWIFDSFQLRGGAAYEISVAGGSQDAATSSSYSQPEVHTNVEPRIGLGVSKAFFTLDVSLNPAAWSGFFVGPSVAVATATVKF